MISMDSRGEQNLRLPELLGTPRKGIIFTDLDGVWLDEDANFQSPDPEDLRILDSARDGGYWVVLNSDSAIETLDAFSQNLRCDPLLIGENGAIIGLPKQGIVEYLSPFKKFFDQFRRELVTKLITERPNAGLYVGDATQFITQVNRFPPGANSAYLINSARQCSIGVYTREVGPDGTLVINDERTQETEQMLRSLLENKLENGQVECFRYPNLGSCLVKEPAQAKWKGVEWVINQFPLRLQYYMIGDRIYDSMEPLSDRVVTCAVGNARIDLKESVARTNGIQAPDDLRIAKGANYIIQEILKR